MVINGDGLLRVESNGSQWHINFKLIFNIVTNQFYTGVTELDHQVALVIDTYIEVFRPHRNPPGVLPGDVVLDFGQDLFIGKVEDVRIPLVNNVAVGDIHAINDKFVVDSQ